MVYDRNINYESNKPKNTGEYRKYFPKSPTRFARQPYYGEYV